MTSDDRMTNQLGSVVDRTRTIIHGSEAAELEVPFKCMTNIGVIWRPW